MATELPIGCYHVGSVIVSGSRKVMPRRRATPAEQKENEKEEEEKRRGNWAPKRFQYAFLCLILSVHPCACVCVACIVLLLRHVNASLSAWQRLHMLLAKLLPYLVC